MTVRINEILIPDGIAGDYAAEQPFNSLYPISKLNVFFGPNNSGKSRLLRELFGVGPLLRIGMDGEEFAPLRYNAVKLFEAEHARGPNEQKINEAVDVLRTTKLPFVSLRSESLNNNTSGAIDQLVQLAKRVNSNDAGDFLIQLRNQYERIIRARRRQSEDAKKADSRQNTKWEHNHAKFVYIPTLRGLRCPAEEASRSFYRDRTFADYFAKVERVANQFKRNQAIESEFGVPFDKTEIVTGWELFHTVRSHLLGTLQQRDLIREYEGFVGETFFDGVPVSLIPREGDDVLHIKIGSEKEREVYRLGDGIQQILIMTLPLFVHRDHCLMMFIEEPDLHLHPGFQRILIDTFLERSGLDHYVFITTHSQQFLDITITDDHCSLFRVAKDLEDSPTLERDPHFSVTNTPRGEIQLLEDVGVRPSSVMLANCTIWVEGITDRLYLQRYLAVMMEESHNVYIENLHFAFVEYGGANITHWSFLCGDDGMAAERTCATLFLVTDRDAGKDERQTKLRETLGDRYYCLQCREIENLLSPRVLSAVVKSYESDDFEPQRFEHSEYADRYLGRFIENHILPRHYVSKRPYKEGGNPYSAGSGTIKDKPAFCRKALEHIDSPEDLSDEAKALAMQMIEFIAKHNP